MSRKYEKTYRPAQEAAGPAPAVTAPTPEKVAQERQLEAAKRNVVAWAVAGGIDMDAMAEALDGPETVIEASKLADKFQFRPSKDHLVGHVMLPVMKETGLSWLGWRKRTLAEKFERVYVDTRTKEGAAIINGPRWRWKLIMESMPVDFSKVQLEADFKPKDKNLREDWFGSDGSGTGGEQPNSEYIPLLGGPTSKQLYLYDHLDAHAKCFEAKNHNPLAKQAIDVISNYSLGKGVTVQFNNARVQEAFDRYSSRTRFHWRKRQDCDQLTWEGNTLTYFGRDDRMRLVPEQIDPSTVWEIVTNPRNINEIWYYHQQYPTQFQMTFDAKAAGLDSNPDTMQYVINELPADRVIHTKVNCTSGEKWGRSDLFSVLGWMKFFKDFYCAAVVQAQAQASYYLKRKVKGAQTDVTAYAADPMVTSTPRPGSAIIENESVDTTFMTSETGSLRANDNAGEALRSIIATGMGLAPEHLGVGGAASTRATSLTKAQPAARKFENRQWVMELDIRQEVDYWLTNDAEARQVTTQISKIGLAPIIKAVKTGKFHVAMKLMAVAITGATNYQEPVDKQYEVFFPDINTEDRSNTIKDIYTAFSFGSYSHEAASRKVAKLLGDTTYDYNDQQETRRQEEQDDLLKPVFALTPPWGGGKGAAGDAGVEPVGGPGSAKDINGYKDTATDTATA